MTNEEKDLLETKKILLSCKSKEDIDRVVKSVKMTDEEKDLFLKLRELFLRCEGSEDISQIRKDVEKIKKVLKKHDKDVTAFAKEIKMTEKDLRTEVLNRYEQLKQDSGDVVLDDTLATFLYLLMRDYVTPGKIELLVQNVVDGAESVTFGNGFLAKYAENLAKEIRNKKVMMLTNALGAAFTDEKARVQAQKEEREKKILSRTQIPDSDLEQSAETINTAFENLSEDKKAEAEKMWDEDVETTNLVFKEKAYERGKKQVKLANEAEQIKQEATQMLEETNNPEPSIENALAYSAGALQKIKSDFPEVADVADILKNEILVEFNTKKQTREKELNKRAEEVKQIAHAKTKEEQDEAVKHITTKVELVSVETQSPISEEAREVLDAKTPKKKGRGTLGEIKDRAEFKEKIDKVVDENASSNSQTFHRVG